MTLQELGAASGLTIDQLAARAGVRPATVAKRDAGTLRANPVSRRRLADVLGLAPAALRDAPSAARRTRARTPSGSRRTPGWPPDTAPAGGRVTRRN